jgi:hypothetical protein
MTQCPFSYSLAVTLVITAYSLTLYPTQPKEILPKGLNLPPVFSRNETIFFVKQQKISLLLFAKNEKMQKWLSI